MARKPKAAAAQTAQPEAAPVKPQWDLRTENGKAFAQRGHEVQPIRGDLSAIETAKLLAKLNAE